MHSKKKLGILCKIDIPSATAIVFSTAVFSSTIFLAEKLKGNNNISDDENTNDYMARNDIPKQNQDLQTVFL